MGQYLEGYGAQYNTPGKNYYKTSATPKVDAGLEALAKYLEMQKKSLTTAQLNRFKKLYNTKLMSSVGFLPMVPELMNMVLDKNYMKQNLTPGQAVRAIDPTQGEVL